MDPYLITNENVLQIDETTLESLPYDDEIIQKVITKIQDKQTSILKEDTLGILFEELIRDEERKDLGQFYTPQEIVDYMIDYLDIKPDSKILDPTCGCGVFLVTAYNSLKKLNRNALNNIYGVDLNESATKITRINLWLRNGKDTDSLRVLEDNIKTGNSVVETESIDSNAFDWKKEVKCVLEEGGFDFVVGNPPYITLKNGRDYDVRESIFSKIANGNTNLASLVLARSFELLKEGGVMAFVLPKTMLRVNSYSRLRDFILENSKVLQVYDLGPCFDGVRGEQIILFLQKTKNKEDIKKHKVSVKVYGDKTETLRGQKEFIIPQDVFKKYNVFLLFDDKKYYELIEKINNSAERLEKISDIFRGLAISPESSLVTKSKGKNRVTIVKGNNISKFSYKTEYFIEIDRLAGSESKLKQFKHEKVILQNIFSSESGIISTIDRNGNLNFDTVTNIVIKDDNIETKYVLGLLNSKIINFCLIYGIYNKSKLTMHTDRTYIGKLPIKKIGKKGQKEIVNIVEKIEKTHDKKPLLRELDMKVYEIYGISLSESKLVEGALENLMSERSRW